MQHHHHDDDEGHHDDDDADNSHHHHHHDDADNGHHHHHEFQSFKPHFKLNGDFTNHPDAHSSTQNITAINGYTPTQIRAAYGIQNLIADGIDGTGQTIAIVDAYLAPNIVSDFAYFDKQFNIGKPNNIKTYAFTSQIDQGWTLEESLDVQWAHALAPGATIFLVQAKSDSTTDLLSAVNYAATNGADIISMSWGSSESKSETTLDSNFKSNLLYVASAGDTPAVSWPSTSDTVISAGGTSLSLDANGNRLTAETTWSDGGGGTSKYEPIPADQSAYGISGKYRQTPDLSFFANPNPGVAVYDSYGYSGQKGWFQVGGTSVSSPCIAAIFALANQLRLKNNKSILTYNNLPNYLYNTMAKGSQYAINFNDIISGKDGNNSAKTGYDDATGLGSPKNTSAASGFIADLLNL